MYVWLDALTNYITALGYGSNDTSKFEKYWPADVHIVGKDIIRFHGIYWPIFLMALNLPLPKKLYAHGWIMMKDGKMSKSKGNIVYPELLIERYGLDATKYFLLKELQFGQDGVFTPEGFVERYNIDLCNDLGNLLNRTVGMINKYFGGVIPDKGTVKNEQDEGVENFVLGCVKAVETNMDSLHISNALSEIWEIISRSNKYIDETAPWVLAKSENEEDKEKLKSVMYHLAENLRIVAILLRPFMAETSKKMLDQLGIEKEEQVSWDSIQNYGVIEEGTKVIEKGEPLFVRLDMEEEINYIREGMKN